MSQVVTFPRNCLPLCSYIQQEQAHTKCLQLNFWITTTTFPSSWNPLTSTPSHLHKKGMSTGPLVFPKLIVIQCRFSSIATFKKTWAQPHGLWLSLCRSGQPSSNKWVSLRSRIWNQMKVRLQCCMNSAASSSLQRNWGLDDWTHSILTFSQFSGHNSIGALHM